MYKIGTFVRLREEQRRGLGKIHVGVIWKYSNNQMDVHVDFGTYQTVYYDNLLEVVEENSDPVKKLKRTINNRLGYERYPITQ